MPKESASKIETNVGLFIDFVSATMDVLRDKAVLFEAVCRLITIGGYAILNKIVDRVYVDEQAEEPKLVEEPEIS